MKTRYSVLVDIKQDIVKKSETEVARVSANLNSAMLSLDSSRKALGEIALPKSGTISDLLVSRTLLSSQRGVIQNNQKWVESAKKQVELAKEKLKSDMIEHEKFKYLELEEIKRILKEQKILEAKELDEIAIITHNRK